MIAVDDMESMIPITSPSRQSRATNIAASPKTAETPITCNAPSPKICLRKAQSFDGSNSNPIRNNITITPNSANCFTVSPLSPTRLKADGPISAPAIKNPNTELRLSLLAISADITAAVK